MQEPSASQSVRVIAVSGDRARRLSLARARIARYALPVAALACLTSALAPVLGGPRTIGLFVLAAGAAAAGLTLLAARRQRALRDDAVAELDRAADLGGSLRSAHWFAVQRPATVDPEPNLSWIERHVEAAAAQAVTTDWTRIYHRPTARLPWALTLACAVATLALVARPLPRLARPPGPAVESTAAPTTAPPPAADAFMPQVVEGIRAMGSGRTPSETQLTAIGRALDAAKTDPAARKRIEAQVSGSEANRTGQYPRSDSDSDSGGWTDDLNNGFEIADLDWAYQEALARARMEEGAHQSPSGEATRAQATGDAVLAQRPGEPAAAGALSGAPVSADTRGQPVNFTSLLSGRQQANGDGTSADRPQAPGRAAHRSAALRQEVIHASSDVPDAGPDLPKARRATNAERTPAGGPAIQHQVRYDRSRATQPPAVPEARRSLVHDFFLRPAEAPSPAKRP